MDENKQNQTWHYPHSRREERVEILHGVAVADPYRWLEEPDSEETRRWIEDQNRLTLEFLENIPQREAIRKSLEETWNFERYGVPFQRGGRIFFTCNDGLQNQSVLYWMPAADQEARMLLDPNGFSEDGTVALTDFAASEDGKLLAYGLSASGSDWQDWYVRQVDNGEDLTDHLEWVKFSIASWTSDSQGFFYCRYDPPEKGQTYKEANYGQRVCYHRLGESQDMDRLVYDRPDNPDWVFYPQVSEDGRYLIIHASVGTRRETAIYYQDLQNPTEGVIGLIENFDATYYFVGNDGPRFYFHTDLNAPRARVICVDIRQPGKESWIEVIAEKEDALESASMVHGLILGIYLHDAYHQVLVFDQNGTNLRNVDLPGMGTVAGFGGRKADVNTFYLFTSFTTPGTVYQYDLELGKSQVFREPRLGFDPGDFVTRQIFYHSKDGTRLPMFICYKKGLKLDGRTRTYLYGYGGFNISLTPEFKVNDMVWMESGGIYAQANLRGGGEYGKSWHEAGMKQKKQNVFDDFIAAAEWLIENGYTRPEKLAISGRSNGGLLTAACLVQRPDLFGAVLAAVGVLDMLRFNKFTIGWAWVSDYGSPDDPEEFKSLLAYSPYHNLKNGASYPATLILTGDHDDRVFPAHSFKFAAALQAAQGGDAPALIRIETKAGHGIGRPTSKLIEEGCDALAFLLYELGG
jgi:prolyl oligopeptidase